VFAAGLEEYLEPEGVTVIEWAEKLGEAPSAKRQAPSAGRGVSSAESGSSAARPNRWRWAQIETVGETERRVIYEDFGG
jgi:tRNA A37 threonylcarbamoyladenosine biosynthesis protein TsaE